MGVIPVAFAIVESSTPGHFFAVKLTNVVAEHAEQLVPGKNNTTTGAMALQRALRGMEIWRNKSKLRREPPKAEA